MLRKLTERSTGAIIIQKYSVLEPNPNEKKFAQGLPILYIYIYHMHFINKIYNLYIKSVLMQIYAHIYIQLFAF